MDFSFPMNGWQGVARRLQADATWGDDITRDLIYISG